MYIFGVIKELPSGETNGCSIQGAYTLIKKARETVIIWVSLALKCVSTWVAKDRAWAAGLVVRLWLWG